MIRQVFAMRRANGDLFALKMDGVLRVAIFRSLTGAWRVRAKNPQLALFWPVLVDERTLSEIARADDGRPVGFWLVDEDDPSCNLRLGRPLEHAELLALFTSESARPPALRFTARWRQMWDSFSRRARAFFSRAKLRTQRGRNIKEDCTLGR
jgi:hypothetical protein